MEQKRLFPMVRQQVQDNLNGYLGVPQITDRIEDYIMPPKLGGRRVSRRFCASAAGFSSLAMGKSNYASYR